MRPTWIAAIVVVVLVGASSSFPTGSPQESDRSTNTVQDVKMTETLVGDMVLDEEQITHFQHQGDGKKSKRNARDFAGEYGWDHRWIDGKIPYVMGYSLNYEYKSDIRTAIQQMEAVTCLQFTDITYDSSKQGATDSFIVFERHSDVCTSGVGRRLAGWSGLGFPGMPMTYTPYGGKQTINLGPKGPGGCNTGVPAVLHEIGHALGFYHEHNRWDRDDYIRVNWHNSVEVKDQSVNLDKLERATFTDYGVPYDYRSIMHYGDTATATKSARYYGGVVFQAKDSRYQKVMGRGTKLSFGDIKLLNRMYSCKGKAVGGCGRTCNGDGYVDKYCVCQCSKDDGQNVQRCSDADQGTVNAVTVPPATQPPPVTEATTEPNKYRCDENCDGRPNSYCECTCTRDMYGSGYSCTYTTYG